MPPSAAAVDQVLTVLLESRLGKQPHESLENSLVIIRILLDSKCCTRCCLRYLGCTDFQVYALNERDLFEAFNNIKSEYSADQGLTYPNSVCTACLGSIQYAESFVEDVVEKLKKEDYKTDSVCITCTLPVSVLPRDHLLKVHVMNRLRDQNREDLFRVWKTEKDVRDPKDFFKYLFGLGLREKTGLSLDTDAAFKMNVVVGHEATAKEHMFLTELKEPLLNIRSIRQKVKKKKNYIFSTILSNYFFFNAESTCYSWRFKILYCRSFKTFR